MLVTVWVAVAELVALWVVVAAALWVLVAAALWVVVLVAGGAEGGDVVGRAGGWGELVVLLPTASAICEDEDAASSGEGAPHALRPIAPARATATSEGILIPGMLRAGCVIDRWRSAITPGLIVTTVLTATEAAVGGCSSMTGVTSSLLSEVSGPAWTLGAAESRMRRAKVAGAPSGNTSAAIDVSDCQVPTRIQAGQRPSGRSPQIANTPAQYPCYYWRTTFPHVNTSPCRLRVHTLAVT